MDKSILWEIGGWKSLLQGTTTQIDIQMFRKGLYYEEIRFYGKNSVCNHDNGASLPDFLSGKKGTRS